MSSSNDFKENMVIRIRMDEIQKKKEASRKSARNKIMRPSHFELCRMSYDPMLNLETLANCKKFFRVRGKS